MGRMNKQIIVGAVLLSILPVEANSETITKDMSVGCPSEKAYDRFVELAYAGATQWEALGGTGCKVSFKGDRVQVLEYKMLKNLVRVRPAWGGPIDFWYSSSSVSTD